MSRALDIHSVMALQGLDGLTEIDTVIGTLEGEPDTMPAGPLGEYMQWLDEDAFTFPMTSSFWAGTGGCGQ